MALLEVSNLGIAFGGLQAVAQLDLSIEKGHLYGLIGPNGAGKTTVFNMLTGVYKPTEGNIILDGKDITGQNPELISKSGIAGAKPVADNGADGAFSVVIYDSGGFNCDLIAVREIIKNRTLCYNRSGLHVKSQEIYRIPVIGEHYEVWCQ